MPFTVIGGPSSTNLAKRIATKLDANYVESKCRVFPDGEGKITLEKTPKRGKIVVVQSTFPPVDSNIVQALSLISKARQYSSHVIAVIPYFAYMRQDMEFLPGEIVTSSIIARLFSMVGATKIISVDIHSKLALNYFDIPIKNISAVSKLALYFKKMRLKNPLVVAPDLFWSNQAKEFATILDTKSIAMNKQRNRKTGKIYIKATKKMDLMQRDIILIDDMISTGGSVIEATEYLKDQNCGNVYAACTHALLVDDAEKKIKRAGVKKIISTNTIPNKNSIIDVSDIITHAI